MSTTTNNIGVDDNSSHIVFDVFVADRLNLEPFVFDCWLKGMSPLQIAKLRKETKANISIDYDLLLADSQDQCRSLSMLERYLRHGQLLDQQSLFQLEAQQRFTCFDFLVFDFRFHFKKPNYFDFIIF